MYRCFAQFSSRRSIPSVEHASAANTTWCSASCSSGLSRLRWLTCLVRSLSIARSKWSTSLTQLPSPLWSRQRTLRGWRTKDTINFAAALFFDTADSAAGLMSTGVSAAPGGPHCPCWCRSALKTETTQSMEAAKRRCGGGGAERRVACDSRPPRPPSPLGSAGVFTWGGGLLFVLLYILTPGTAASFFERAMLVYQYIRSTVL